MPTPLFERGRASATPGAIEVLERIGYAAFNELLGRHLTGKWGDVCDENRQANDQAVMDGERIVSRYGDGADRLWFITDAVNGNGNRERTTVLTPDEFLEAINGR
jgi:hypothetical protein